MLGRHHHVGGAEKRIGPGREDPDVGLMPIDVKADLRANALADPVGLQLPDRIGPVHLLEIIEQSLGVFRDAKHPLPHRLANHRMPAALAQAPDHFLVGQHRTQRGAPVHRHVRLVGQPVLVDEATLLVLAQTLRNGQFVNGPGLLLIFIEIAIEKLQEDPLRPLVILVVRRGDFAIPIVAESQRFGLPAHVGDVIAGRLLRVRSGLDGMLLGGQPERIPAERMQDVEPFHALVAGHDIAGGVSLRVPDVQPLAAGIGKHIQDVVLRPGGVAVLRTERPVLRPIALPLPLNLTKIVTAFSFFHTLR